jgi:hypothetical protein
MSGESISITVTDKGVQIDAEGFKDGACLKDLDKILISLKNIGISVNITDQRLKPEGMINAQKGSGNLLKR